MGAIAAFLSASAADPERALAAMMDVVPHRGTRRHTLIHGSCALACVDSEDLPDAALGAFDGIAVAFAGSLDNADELAREIGRIGVGLPPDLTPSSLLAAGFRAFRADLPARLRGVFSAAITDGRSVHCFRDHIGYRPLFWRADAHGFFAASEAKQVVAGAGIPKEPDLEVVERIVFRDYDDETPAALIGVRRLPKSTVITASDDGVRLRKYWHPERLLETARLSRDDIRARFDELMDQAVSRTLTGRDVISLSGGIDSPAVAAYGAPRHAERFGRPLPAMTVVYPKYPSVDERRYVEPVAAALGMPVHFYEQEANALADLDRWVALADTPYPAASLAHYAEDYGRARNLGFRRVLTGEHAEYVVAMQWLLLDHYLTHGRWQAARRELRTRRARGWSWFSLTRLVMRSLAPDPVMRLRHSFGARRASTVPAWIDRRRVARNKSASVRGRWSRIQLTGFIGPGIALEAEEVCQAVSGVDARRPWTDIDLWEFFLSLPAEQKFPDLRPKGLVRDLLRGRVPDEILDRTDKTVFDAAGLAEVDYATLRRYLRTPTHRLRGVDYDRLATVLDGERVSVVELGWLRNLATAHAFLAQW
jgi:asparagine synthase (glutamine-hydrolysing)